MNKFNLTIITVVKNDEKNIKNNSVNYQSKKYRIRVYYC